jgi:hypothetical protein
MSEPTRDRKKKIHGCMFLQVSGLLLALRSIPPGERCFAPTVPASRAGDVMRCSSARADFLQFGFGCGQNTPVFGLPSCQRIFAICVPAFLLRCDPLAGDPSGFLCSRVVTVEKIDALSALSQKSLWFRMTGV